MRKKRIRADREGNRAIVPSFLPTKQPNLRYEQSLRFKIVTSDNDPIVYFEHDVKLWVLVVNSAKASWLIQTDLCKLCFDLDIVLAKTHPANIAQSLHAIVLYDYLRDHGLYDAAEEFSALVKHYTIRKCSDCISTEVLVPADKINCDQSSTIFSKTPYCDLIESERFGDMVQCDVVYYGQDALELIKKACVIEHKGKPFIKLEL
jgi:hypothetical protein